MKTFTPEEVNQILAKSSLDNYELDNGGQIVIYSDVWIWEDGSYHDCPEYNN